MTVEQSRILTELPLPLGSGAGELDAIEIAIAIEDACGVTLPDEVLDRAHLGQRASIESVLNELTGP